MMTRNMIVSMRSGEKHVVKLHQNEAASVDVCEEFYNGIDFDEITVLRVNNKIFMIQYVEAITFIDEEDEHAI